MDALLRSESLKRRGRSARELSRSGDLHVLLIALGPGEGMPEHSVDGPALVQTLQGELVVRAGDDAWTLSPGRLLSIAPGLPHSADTAAGCVLLAVVHSAGELRLFG